VRRLLAGAQSVDQPHMWDFWFATNNDFWCTINSDFWFSKLGHPARVKGCVHKWMKMCSKSMCKWMKMCVPAHFSQKSHIHNCLLCKNNILPSVTLHYKQA
jgi:hypothetical protein